MKEIQLNFQEYLTIINFKARYRKVFSKIHTDGDMFYAIYDKHIEQTIVESVSNVDGERIEKGLNDEYNHYIKQVYFYVK